jgi:hypothetical protein
MSTPNPPEWTLHRADITGDSDGEKLHGCHIRKNDAGTAYEFTEPNINKVLSTTRPPLPQGAFTFPSFDYKDVKGWVIGVIAPLISGVTAIGTWNTPGVKPGNTQPQSGDFTAQSGSGLGEDDAAACAKA